MAGQNDIELDIGLKLDPSELKKTVKTVADVAEQIDKIWDAASKSMQKRLKANLNNPQYMAFGGISPGIEENFRALEDAVTSNLHRLKNPRNSLLKYYQKENLPNNLIRLEMLQRYANMFSPYSGVYKDIADLKKLTAEDNIDPQVGVGKYGVNQRRVNRFRGILYNASLAFPDIVNREVLEIAEYFRDINLKSGSQNRAANRYVQDKKYNMASVARAANYMLLDPTNPNLRALNEIYGLGLEPTGKTAGRYSQKAFDNLSLMAYHGLEAQKNKEALKSWGLSAKDRNAYFLAYKEHMKKFIDLQEKLFPQEKTIAENLKKLNRADVFRFGKGAYLSNILSAAGGFAIGRTLANAGSEMLQSYWGEAIPRNVYASQQAYYKRWETGGKAFGTVAGGIIGAILGSFFGPGGTVAGASIGSGIGSFGGLYGTYKGTKYEADIKSSTDVMSRLKAKTLFGAGYNPYFAQQITTMGFANGEAALQQLSHNAMTFRSRVMLGQVGEQEWLYLSMMPNYFNALMSGVTGQELARIYANDLNAIGDKSMRYLIGENLGGTEALAMATNKEFPGLYDRFASTASKYDTMIQPLEAGYVGTRAKSTLESTKQNLQEIVNTAFRADPTIFGDQYLVKLKQAGIVASGDAWEAKERWSQMLGMDKNGKLMVVKEINNIVNIDGEEVSRETKTADQMYEENLQSFYVGGN